MVLRQFLAGDVGEVRALAQELDQRRAVVEAGHAHQVVNVVAVQAVRRRRQDEVAAALLQLVGGQHGRLRAVGFFLGDELEVVRGDVEDAAGGAVGHRDGHAAFAGDQADVAHRRVAEIAREVPQVRADAAARPVADEQLVRAQ